MIVEISEILALIRRRQLNLEHLNYSFFNCLKKLIKNCNNRIIIQSFF